MKQAHALDVLKTPFVVVFLIATVIFPGRVSAAGTAIVSASAPAEAVSPGAQFIVGISVQPDSGIAGVQFDLFFNPLLVSVNSVTEGNLLKQGGANTYFLGGTIDNAAGTVSGVVGTTIGPDQTVSGPGTMAIITMTAGTVEGSCPLTLSNVIVGDMDGNTATTNVVNGDIVIGRVSNNRPPVLSGIGSKSVNEGATLRFSISATDPDGDTLTYSASNLPAGATFDATSHTFSWTPTSGQGGSYAGVHFEVSDGALADFENITIAVKRQPGRRNGSR